MQSSFLKMICDYRPLFCKLEHSIKIAFCTVRMKKTTLFARLNIYHLLNYGILSVLMICVFFMFLKSNQKSILIRLTEEKLQVLEHEIGRGSFEGECPSFDNKGILQPDLPESEFWLVFSTDYTLLYQSANFNELDKPDAFLEHLFQSLRTAPDSLSGSYSVLFPEKGRAFLAVTCNPASHLCFCYLIFPGQSKGYETRNPTSFLLISLLFILLGGGIIGLINSFISRPYKRLSALIGEKEGKSSEVQFEGNEVHFLAKVYEKHKNQIGMLEEIIQKTSERNIQLENDLKLAKKLQRNLLPAITPAFTNRKEFSLYALSESAFDIGGDLYDYFMIDNDRLLVAVGDVAGKGITASLYMIYTHPFQRLRRQ